MQDRILRADDYDPRSSRIFFQALSQSRCNAGRIFAGIFRRSSIMTGTGILDRVFDAYAGRPAMSGRLAFT